MSYNPNSTGTVGNEWRAYKKGTTALNSNSVGVAAYINSTATETVDSLIIPHTASGASSSYGKLWADVYNAADLGVNETPTIYTYVPNQDISIVSLYYHNGTTAWNGPASGNNVYQYVDDTSDESSDYLHYPANAITRFAFNTAGLPAGRVLSITIEVRAFGYSGTSGQGLSLDMFTHETWVTRWGLVTPSTNSSDTNKNFQNYSFGPFYVNPLTEEPWTRADIISFDTGTNLLLQLTSRGNTTAVAAFRLKVAMIAEKRVAMGPNTKTTSPASGLVTTNVHTLKTPALVDNWAKSSSLDYVVVVRRLDDSQGWMTAQSFTVPNIDSGVANPHNQGHSYPVTIDGSGRLLTAPGIETKAYPILMALTSGALSADSQVYHTLSYGKVYSGTDSEQRISNAASTTYGTARAVVGYIGTPSADLLFKIKRHSDNTQMGGTGTLTFASLATQTFLGVADGITWYDVTVNLASNATLVSGTQYYIELSSSASSSNPWYVRGLDYTEGHSFTTDQSYGGSTDSMILEGVAVAQGDLAATISSTASVPDPPPPSVVIPPPVGAPTSLTVVTATYTLPDAGDPTCDPGSHQAARLAWGASSEAGLFDYYAIERSEDGGTTWTLIKRVHTEATVTFDDVEAKRGVALKYRIRVVRTTGQFGSYITQSGTVTLTRNTAAVVFCSNAYPELTCGYIQLGADHEYTFLNDSEVSVVQMHERDYSVVFRPIENRGVMWQIPVLVFTKGHVSVGNETPPSGKGMAAFDAVRAIVEADAPYVCVHTPDGERLFAALRLPSGRRSEPAAFYTATITAIQVASVPSVVD